MLMLVPPECGPLGRCSRVITGAAKKKTIATHPTTAPTKKKKMIGEAPGQRPGDVFFPNMYNGEGCAADIAVTCPLRDVYARLALRSCP